MVNRFKELLERYTNNTASPAERSEFLALFKTRKFDHLVGPKMLEDFRSQAELTEMERSSVEKIVLNFDTMRRPGGRMIRFNRPRIWMVAAAVISLAVVSTFVVTKLDLFPNYNSDQLATTSATVYSGMQVIMLPDGTQVTLNKDSELSFDSATFGKSTREVTLEGEAFFDVIRDPSRQFVVKTGVVNTKVLGTAFNISAYPSQKEITVTVVRGLVEVGDGQRVFGKIRFNEQIQVDVALNDFVKRDVRSEDVLGWQRDFFILDNVTFADAASLIGERFNVKVTIANDELKDCIVNAWFLNDENLIEVVESISLIGEATATFNGDSIIIKGGTGCK